MPCPGLIFLTITRARTSPPGTSNTTFNKAPTGGGSEVAINNPPNPSVETRDTERPALYCQAISMPLGNATRVNLRFAACETFATGTLLPGLGVLFILTGCSGGDNRLWRDASLTRQRRRVVWMRCFPCHTRQKPNPIERTSTAKYVHP